MIVPINVDDAGRPVMDRREQQQTAIIGETGPIVVGQRSPDGATAWFTVERPPELLVEGIKDALFPPGIL